MITKKQIYALLFSLIFFCTYIAYTLYPRPYYSYIKEIAKTYNINELFIYSIIQTESHFNANAISRSGARGCMQIMEKTGYWIAQELQIEDYEHSDLFNPYINIHIGSWYISRLIQNYQGNVNLALAAYNGGSGNVSKWLKDTRYSHDGRTLHTIPFAETRNYITKVNFHYLIYKILYFFNS
ncbi:MAG: lytic transglycosylase [Candidatus Epulonipiscioides saccharophilum]|nr:MAG: lytic transglycosylase [Epulopiscium sp. AS2M-Bin001]